MCECKKRLNSENNQFVGTSRGGKTKKIHAIVDGLENPVHFMLTGGQVHDSAAATPTLTGVSIFGSNALGDKACGSADIRNYITANGATYTFPPKENCAEIIPLESTYK